MPRSRPHCLPDPQPANARPLPLPGPKGTRVKSHRTFIRRTAQAGVGLTGAAGLTAGYGVWEAAHIRVVRHTVPVPNLPPAFAGKTVAVLADLHHGPFVGIEFIRDAVRLASHLHLLMQQFLNFLPLLQGQGSFRPALFLSEAEKPIRRSWPVGERGVKRD